MYNRKSLASLLLLTAAVGAGVVIACGPDFPAQLLDDRSGTLRSTPANSFGYEAAHLLAATDKLRANESYALPDGSYRPDSIPEDYDPALNAAQRAAARAMRALPDGDQAYKAGTAMPEPARQYTAAAVDIRAGESMGDESALARARSRLRAILELPAEQSAMRGVWAAYMLAEIGDAAEGADDDPDDDAAWRNQAVRAYARVRQLARDGAADPLGLAVASYGQEARLFLTGPQGPCDYADFADALPCADAIAPAAMQRAIRLYAEQAARGSRSGRVSLLLLADWALSAPQRASRLIDDPIARRLLVVYALARVGDIVDGNPDSAFDTYAAFNTTGHHGYADAALGAHNVAPNPALQSLVAALEKQDLRQVQDADRVAALAYRIGRYDLAQSLAGRLDTALAWWVRAKLAIRQGDMALGAQAYARAAGAFPLADDSVEGSGAARLKAEQGVLALSRGQYIEALDQLFLAASSAHATDIPDEGWPLSAYWNDAAYVAERVLTVDELKAYVDQQAPASAAPAEPDGFRHFEYERFYQWARQHPIPAADRLRQLLARRLVREGRIDQALAYFPADADPRFATLVYEDDKLQVASAPFRRLAADYGKALQRAGNAWGRSARAQAWYDAALLARRNGLEIMGYEQGPDFAVYDGNYTYGAGRSTERWWEDDAGRPAQAPADTAEARAAAALAGPYITPGERSRFAASEARPYSRFHYRQVAAGHASRAADLLPHRSQAFAAVLCQGTRYVIDDAPATAAAMYQRYIDQGAQVPFSGTFGRVCPAPDFEAAAWFHYTQAWKAWSRLRHDHPGLLLAAGALILAAAGAAVLAWRKAARTRPQSGR
jgi:hypothetical protein